MKLAFNANTARMAGTTLSDGSIGFGVDLLDAWGGELGEEFVHIPCQTKEHAWTLLHAMIENGDCSLSPEVLRPYE